jgi:hypothetical protein
VTTLETTAVPRRKRSFVWAAGALQGASFEHTGFVGLRVTTP